MSRIQPLALHSAALKVVTEAERASQLHDGYNSAHEGFAVLLEEVEELKAHVFTKQRDRDYAAMRKEAVQIGAVALRFIASICDTENRT